MKIELERFRIKPGMSQRADEWMKMLNNRLPECLATFPREKMALELIFRDTIDGSDYLYWFSIQGEGGESVHTSEHDLDIEHIKFSRECIDTEYGVTDEQGQHQVGHDLALQVFMAPDQVLAALRQTAGENGTMPA